MTLSADMLAIGYRSRVVGRGIDLRLEAGEVLCLLGPNGGGKTTLFRTLLGLIPALNGRVRLGQRDLSDCSRREVAAGIAYVPQAHATLFPFTVQEMVLMGRTARLGLFETPSAADRRLAETALRTLGISHLAARVFTEISGGERQLALIARALAQEAPILVMDEPTASLDFGNQARVLQHIRALAKAGKSILLSTHDPDHAFLCADRVALLHGGELIAVGAPDDTITPDHLKRLYGIDVTIALLPELGRRVCTPSLATFDPDGNPDRRRH